MFTTDNTIDSTPEQLAALNGELSQRLHGIDPNDYAARQKVEVDFRAEVHARPKPSGQPSEPMGARLIEHDEEALAAKNGGEKPMSDAEREAAEVEQEHADQQQAKRDEAAADERAAADKREQERRAAVEQEQKATDDAAHERQAAEERAAAENSAAAKAQPIKTV